MRCLYCDKEIPIKTVDKRGRKLTKKSPWCNARHYRLWWNKENKAYRSEVNRAYYLKEKISSKK